MNLVQNSRIGGGKGTLAFTLVEMMVVIAIVGILAGLLMSAFPQIIKKANVAKVQAAFKQLDVAIADYHATLNSYPLDNPTNRQVSPLYYELQGSSWNAASNSYDMVGERILEADVRKYFGQDGLRNVTQAPNDPASPKAKSFLVGVNTASYIVVSNALNVDIKAFQVPVKDYPSNMIATMEGGQANLWYYRSGTNAVFNKGKYDLWAEFESGGTRYRVSNWEKDVVRIEDTPR